MKKRVIKRQKRPRTYEKERCAVMFTRNLRRLREAHGLLHRHLAEIVGRDRSTVARWESVSDTFRFPEPDAIDKICDHFKISVAALFEKDGGAEKAFELSTSFEDALMIVNRHMEDGDFVLKLLKPVKKA